MSDLTKIYISLQSLQHLLISCRHLNSILIQKENYFFKYCLLTYSVLISCMIFLENLCLQKEQHEFLMHWCQQAVLEQSLNQAAVSGPVPAPALLSSSSALWEEPDLLPQPAKSISRMLSLPARLQLLFYFSSFRITDFWETRMQKSPCRTGLCSKGMCSPEIVHSLFTFPPECCNG